MSELELVVGPADCKDDNTEDFIEELSMVGELSADRFGTPLTRHTYQGNVVISPFFSEKETRTIVEDTIRKYNVKRINIVYI